MNTKPRIESSGETQSSSVASVSGVRFPISTFNGLLILSLMLIVPLVGLFAQMSLRLQVELVLGAFCIFFLYSVVVFFNIARILKNSTIDCSRNSLFFSGVETTLEVTLSNLKGLAARKIDFCMPLSTAILPDDSQWVECKLQAPSAQRKYYLEFMPLRRDNIECSKVILKISDAFNLVRFQYTLELATPAKFQISANPGMASDEQLPAMLRANSGEAILQRVGAGGREFDSLRRYVPGDDLRKVDWKRSAKGYGLLIKNFRPESHQRIQIIVDCGRRLRGIVDNRELVEYAADAVSHLLHTCSGMDDEFGFFAFHSEVLRSISCRRGVGQQRNILDAVQEIRAGELESDYELLTQWALRERRRSLLLIISSVSNPAGVEAIARCIAPVKARHFPVLLAIADRSLQQTAIKPAKSTLDAYEVAAAVEQLERLELSLAKVKRLGISTIYTDAANLSAELRKAYLEAKISGKL